MRLGHARRTPPRNVGDALRHARRSLCNRLARMGGLPDDAFCRAFAAVVADVEAGFRHEELIMEMLGFASLRTHRADNAMILAALHRVLPEVDGGDCALGRQVVTALSDVLAVHRLNTDLALAMGHNQGGRAGVRPHRRAARPASHGRTPR